MEEENLEHNWTITIENLRCMTLYVLYMQTCMMTILCHDVGFVINWSEFDRDVCIVLGETNYQSDHSLQMADHMVNGTVHDDTADESYGPNDHIIHANVQVTPQKRRG